MKISPCLKASQVDDTGAALLRSKIEARGTSVHVSKNTARIVDGEQCQHKMCFTDETSLETDIILFSAGIRPRDQLARDCGLELGQRGGIVINNQCKTSDPSIFAIGECALWNSQIFGLVAPGYQMAAVVAAALAGEYLAFSGADMSTKLKLMGVDVASIGDAHSRSEGAMSYSFIDEPKGVYKKIVVSADNKKLLGSVLIGDAADYGNLLQFK